MSQIDITIDSVVSTSIRSRQIAASFDVPVTEKSKLEWRFDFPIEADDWNVGLIVGPSGSGKSTVLKHVWGDVREFEWNGASVVDDFASNKSIEEIVSACGAVGFNTIPAWMRPFRVLSNGERFRVDLARRLLELSDPIVVDEFTSVVDRQVAQIASHAVQKLVRKNNRKFVAVGCHYDVIDWLQPDWILDMATRSFTRRRLQRRPDIECTISRVPYAAWHMFAPFHYMSASLHRAARCFGLWANERLVSFAGVLVMPHPKVRDIMRVSRAVTLPDWQGIGLNMCLLSKLGAAYAGIGKRLRTYPAHPQFVRTFQRSKEWRQVKESGEIQSKSMSSICGTLGRSGSACGTFEYVGEKLPAVTAERLLS